jgi:hypothetical protein
VTKGKDLDTAKRPGISPNKPMILGHEPLGASAMTRTFLIHCAVLTCRYKFASTNALALIEKEKWAR